MNCRKPRKRFRIRGYSSFKEHSPERSGTGPLQRSKLTRDDETGGPARYCLKIHRPALFGLRGVGRTHVYGRYQAGDSAGAAALPPVALLSRRGGRSPRGAAKRGRPRAAVGGAAAAVAGVLNGGGGGAEEDAAVSDGLRRTGAGEPRPGGGVGWGADRGRPGPPQVPAVNGCERAGCGGARHPPAPPARRVPWSCGAGPAG